MIDYTAIADNDPGGTVEEAYATLAAETVSASKGVTKQGYISIANDVGFTEATGLERAVIAGIASDMLPKWVDAALQGEGIDVNNPQVEGVLRSLVGPTLTDGMVDAILATGSEDKPVYPGLKPGHVQNARQKRERGEI